MEFYHVCPEWDGKDLQSLYQQYGEEAYEIFAERWPDAGELAQVHVHYVHLYDNVEDAIEHQKTWGGQILVVTIPDDELADWLTPDSYEFDHPMVRDSIPARMVRVWTPTEREKADQAATQLLRQVLPPNIALPESPEDKWLAVKVLAHLAGDRKLKLHASQVLAALGTR